jgi:hypothetical protein
VSHSGTRTQSSRDLAELQFLIFEKGSPGSSRLSASAIVNWARAYLLLFVFGSLWGSRKGIAGGIQLHSSSGSIEDIDQDTLFIHNESDLLVTK